MEPAIGEAVHPSRSRARRAAAVALAVLAVVAVLIADAVQLQAIHQAAVMAGPTPPGAWHDVQTVDRMVFVALSTFVTASIAAIPALLILRRLGRGVGVFGRAVLGAAWLALLLVAALGGRVQPVILGVAGIASPADRVLPVDVLLVTPVTEEVLLLVAVAVVLALGVRGGGIRAGIVLGAAAGLGMTVVETGHYVEIDATRMADLRPFDILAVRFALLGLNLHAVTAALSGGALGAWVAGGDRRRRAWLPLAGVVAAVATHAAWNAQATGALGWAIRSIAPDQWPALPLEFAIASAVSAVLLAVPFLVLVVAWRSGRPREPAPTG